ncbi:DUF262 domain-containing protein [Shewanella chilikensis]|uniref:DUF262 domain-containing protein n=1 Tax=Shewanella chilikensis TaxID=558541 RepID=UPI001CFA0D05|nr:DUF262 domain-containing protein [Shewanella chilikensis]
MVINGSNYSIGEILEALDRKDIIVNKNYQRSSGLWPDGPCSYFIDTILEGFPFPKIYMYEYINRTERKTKKELVDGQQRITTIRRFYNNEFSIRGDSKYKGMKFEDLDDDLQEKFLSYTVSADVIRNATRSEILQMFRRMNAYTLPLNNAEKRHSSFIGEFKWFINEVSDSLNEFFTEFGVFTDRQIVRMGDAEFISDCIIAMEKGIVSASPSELNKIYSYYDDKFDNREKYFDILNEVFGFIESELEPLRNTFMMKPYALHSLVTALIHAKFGINSITKKYNITPIGTFTVSPFKSLETLQELAGAHESKEIDGVYSKYVWGTESSTNKIARREARVLTILAALGCTVGNAEYDGIF